MSVSVIIPILNAKEFLAQAVASVRAQTCSDWELLLVDDGSTDGSVELAREMASQEPSRARYLTHATHGSRGPSATRNLGLSYAQGEFVAYLDADDLWPASKLDHQLAVLRSHPDAAMIFGRVHYFSEDPSGGIERDQTFGDLHEGIYNPPEIGVEFLRDGNLFPCPSATLVRRAPLLEVGGFEDSIRMAEDLALWLKLAIHFPVYADPTIVALYRQHSRSAMAVMLRDEDQYRQNELAFCHWLLTYLDHLPDAVRRPLEPLACQRMFRVSLADHLSEGNRTVVGWRLGMIRRLWHYRAFRREGRWLRYLTPAFLSGGRARVDSGGLRD